MTMLLLLFQKFFKLGIENIRLNNGESSVTDDHIQAVCRQILEEVNFSKKRTNSKKELTGYMVDSFHRENGVPQISIDNKKLV